MWHSVREDVAVKLKHDLQMLRLFEAFSENTPQLTLILSRILQRGELELITGLKSLTSAAGIAFSVALYHRSMLIYLPKKRKMSWISTGVYFLWNLLLIIPRVTALALFCSVLPCYIIAHFLSLWMLLVLVAWSQKTDHMKNPGWEWLFRAAVGLIWYFCWFNVSKKGSIKVKMVLYYISMALDTMMLLGLWCWKVFEYAGCWSSLNPYMVIPTLLGLYIIGILVKMIYYRWFHPKIAEPGEGRFRQAATYNTDLTDSTVSSMEDIAAASVQPLTGALKRSKTMADNFYF
ncbi:XK-related protein 8-like [Carassius gibelio]|uniref:XK-related protein 8-like n=1 Tax=Carassius gibelio TaxID=101364 RepID=UPI002278219F|nr:XK-related protein 8-like [Carassius gibelio]